MRDVCFIGLIFVLFAGFGAIYCFRKGQRAQAGFFVVLLILIVAGLFGIFQRWNNLMIRINAEHGATTASTTH